MKRSLHAWLLYVLCLLIIVPAMVWLSLQVLNVERAREEGHRETELARQSAELQERISSALWRMDGILMPLVAQEASRPHYVYESFYDDRDTSSIPKALANREDPPTPKVGTTQPAIATLPKTPSPLLFQPSKYVLLNFEAAPDGELQSPQVPARQLWPYANGLGCSDQTMNVNCDRLEQADKFFEFEHVLMLCPSTRLPDEAVASLSPNDFEQNDLEQNVLNNSVYAPNQRAMPQQQEGQRRQSNPQLNSEQASLQQAAAEGFDSNLPTQSLQQSAAPTPQQFAKAPSRGGYGGKLSELQKARNDNRGNYEFQKRSQTIQSQSYNLWNQNRNNATTSPFVREGVMKALWLDDNLILARRVNRDEAEVVQCCWLDWELIEKELAKEVADLLPRVVLEPIRNDDNLRPELALAALPAQLVVDQASMLTELTLGEGNQPLPASGLKLGLWIAWGCLGVAAVASGTLLHGVLKLNERRSAFVSAVTHELRTPLTTFRMYAEMLAERMVPSPEKQQEYAQTLKVEADRLAHLVENILQFARLERGNHDDLKETLPIGDIFHRFSERLHERAAQADMTIDLQLAPDFRELPLETTPSAFEQIIFNLVDNACKYARNSTDRRIEIGGRREGQRLCFTVRDHGPGVDDGKRRELFKAFRKSDQDSADTAQGVGLGLALCRRIARRLGGSLELTRKSPGAEFILKLPAIS